ncbi:MAG: hypothetical protein L0H53_12405 [Candidatus Nitrosocosmicus sp.]|nr:hypothetical protein [Candidatus Nitrosocosmicus sp.]
MPKWKKDETEFIVSVTHNEHRGYQCYIPKPIMEKLGKPNSIKFIINNKNIEIKPSSN